MLIKCLITHLVLLCRLRLVTHETLILSLGYFLALSAFCLGNGDMCRMTTPELHDNIENKSFILTNEVIMVL